MKFSDILLLSDFDMTLYWEGTVPQRNIAAIERFIAGGGSFAVATGRSKPAFASHAFDVPMNIPMVLSNGALIYSYVEDKTYGVTPLEPDEHDKILDIYRRFNSGATFEVEAGLEVYLPDVVYAIAENEYTRGHYKWIELVAEMRPLDKIPRPWLKAVFSGEPAFLATLRDTACEIGLNAVLSLPFLCEVQSAKVDKGVAAHTLAAMLGGKTLACAGDAENDAQLLAAADFAFVPSNANDELKMLGYREVCHCRDGAIADIIDILEML